MTIIRSFPVLPTRKQTKFLLYSGILTLYVLHQVYFFDRTSHDEYVLDQHVLESELKSNQKTTPSKAIHFSSSGKNRTSPVETSTNSQSIRDRIRPLFSSHPWWRQQHLVADNSSDLVVVPVLEHKDADSPSYFEVPFVTDHRHRTTENDNDDDKMYTITVFTQVSVNKLPRVRNVVQRWRAPVSCAVYLSTEQDMDTFIDFLEQQQQHVEDGMRWTSFVAFHAMVEPLVVQGDKNKKQKQYPINILRSLALKHVQTDYVFLLDVDFVPSVGANDRIARMMQSMEHQEQQQAKHNTNNNNEVSRHAKTMYILPAFQQFPENGTNTVKNVSTVPSTKKELLYAIQQHRADIFLKNWKRAHLATNYPRWLVLGGSDGDEAINEPYWVTYTSEPGSGSHFMCHLNLNVD